MWNRHIVVKSKNIITERKTRSPPERTNSDYLQKNGIRTATCSSATIAEKRKLYDYLERLLPETVDKKKSLKVAFLQIKNK